VTLLTKAVAVVVVLGLVIFFGARQLLTQEIKEAVSLESAVGRDTVQQETYVSEVIISAPWGEKNLVYDGEASPPGQFGYHVNDETEMGPSCFAVAPNGDIYIVDPLNKRLQKYTSGGSFVSTIPFSSLGKDLRTISVVDLCVNRDDNIYLLLYGPRADWDKATEDNMGRVLKCDQQGNLLQTYPVLTGVASTGSFLVCDNSGRVFYAYPWSAGGAGFYQIGAPQGALSLPEQKDSQIAGVLGFNSVAADKDLFFRTTPISKAPPNRRFRYYAISFAGDSVCIYGDLRGLEGSFFGCDEELNIFVTTDGNVRKYDTRGHLLASWKFGCEKPYLEVGGFGGSRSRTLDREGNLYVLCYSDSEGAKIIKWHKQ